VAHVKHHSVTIISNTVFIWHAFSRLHSYHVTCSLQQSRAASALLKGLAWLAFSKSTDCTAHVLSYNTGGNTAPCQPHDTVIVTAGNSIPDPIYHH
jgi:hypothetical protein